MFALFFSVSCEDDSLPEAGSIADANPPEAAFFFTNSAESVLIKNLTNSSRRGSTKVNWTLPEGAIFTFDTNGVLTTSTDDEIVVKFPATIDDPDDPTAGYPVGIEAIDDNGVSSGVKFFNVQVNQIPGIDEATPIFTFEGGRSNSEVIFTNNSANASGGIFWSVFQNGQELEIDELLVSEQRDFLTQTSTSDVVSIKFPSAGDYEVVLTAINLNGVQTSDSQLITIEPLSEPKPEFTYSSNEDYSVQTFVNTTPDTDSVLWTLDAGATLEPGFELTDEEINVRFSNSGEFKISLEVESVGVDENGNQTFLQSKDEDEEFVVAIVNSLAGIPAPVIIGGDFERPIDDYLTQEGIVRMNNDLGKEYWIAGGISTRVLIPGTDEQFPAFPGESSANERAWFESGEFNRMGITSSGRTGVAVSWDSDQPNPRIAVQRIEVVPGVDYKVTFYYSNDANSTNISLLALILDESVDSEADIDLEGNLIAQEAFNETGTGYQEASITFSVTSSDQTAIKLYFNTSTVFGDYRLDDVSIAID